MLENGTSFNMNVCLIYSLSIAIYLGVFKNTSNIVYYNGDRCVKKIGP